MGYFVTDPSLIALANAGLPPDEQVGAYYQMDEHEIARAAAGGAGDHVAIRHAADWKHRVRGAPDLR
jgi:hypothetical protein